MLCDTVHETGTINVVQYCSGLLTRSHALGMQLCHISQLHNKTVIVLHQLIAMHALGTHSHAAI